MSKRKPKVEDAPQQPKMVSDHSVPNNATLDKLGRDTVYLMLRNASKAIDRLRAEVAAKDAEIARWSKSASLHAEMNAQYGKWFDRIIDAIGCDPDSDPYFGDVASAIVEWANTGVRPKFVTVSTNIPKRKRKATP